MPSYDINTYLGTGNTLTDFYGRALNSSSTVIDQNWSVSIVQGTTAIVPLTLPYNLPNAGDSVSYTLEAALAGSSINNNEPVNWVYLPTKNHHTINVTITKETPASLQTVNTTDGGVVSSNNLNVVFEYGTSNTVSSPIPDYYNITWTNTSIPESFSATGIPHSNLTNPTNNVFTYEYNPGSTFTGWSREYNLDVTVRAKKDGYYDEVDTYNEYVTYPKPANVTIADVSSTSDQVKVSWDNDKQGETLDTRVRWYKNGTYQTTTTYSTTKTFASYYGASDGDSVEGKVNYVTSGGTNYPFVSSGTVTNVNNSYQAPPQNLSALAGSSCDYLFSWDHPTSGAPDHYEYEFNWNSGGWGGGSTTTNTQTTVFGNDGDSLGFRVRAVNSSGFSSDWVTQYVSYFCGGGIGFT